MLELVDKQSAAWMHDVESLRPAPEKGALEGGLMAVPLGAKRVLDVAAEYVSGALDPLAEQTADYWFGKDGVDFVKGQRQKTKDIIEQGNLDAEQLGSVSRMLYSGTGLIGSAVIGGLVGGMPGASAAGGAFYGRERYGELVRQGVDESTATTAGWVSGATMGGAIALAPYYGLSTLAQVASGAGINVATGMVDRGATSAILESNGYKDISEHYKMLDGIGIVSDAVLGAAFPIAARVWKAKPWTFGDKEGTPSQAQIDSGVAGAQQEAQMKSLPVIPDSVDGMNGMTAEMSKAVETVILNDAHIFEASNAQLPEGVINAEMIASMKRVEADSLAARKSDVEMDSVHSMVDDLFKNAKSDFELVKEATVKAGEMVEASSQKYGETSDAFTSYEAKKFIDQNPDMKVTVDGNSMTLKQLEEEIQTYKQTAEQDAKLHNIATACFLSMGE